MGWYCDSDREKPKYNSRIPTVKYKYMYLTVKYICKYLRGFNLFGYFNAYALYSLLSPWPAKMAIHFAKTALHSGSESTPIALWTGPLLIDRWLEISLWKVLLVESWWNAHQQSLFQEDAAGQA